MNYIENFHMKYLDDIVKLAESSNEYLVPNTRMVYYLGCTVFSRYSFVAIQESIPVAFLFSMPNIYEHYIWLHQIAVAPNKRRNGFGSRLIIKLEELISADRHFHSVRCAIKSNNSASKGLFYRHGYNSLGMDININMEIFEKKLWKKP